IGGAHNASHRNTYRPGDRAFAAIVLQESEILATAQTRNSAESNHRRQFLFRRNLGWCWLPPLGNTCVGIRSGNLAVDHWGRFPTVPVLYDKAPVEIPALLIISPFIFWLLLEPWGRFSFHRAR